MPTITKNKIIFDSKDWLSGLHDQYKDSALGAQILTNQLSSISSVDPYRRYGYISAGWNATDLTNVSVIDALITNIEVDSSAKKAYYTAGTKLHQSTLTNDTITTPTTFPKTISAHGGHTTVVAQDVLIYNVGATRYLFYSWKDNTDGDVGRYDLSTTFDDDYMSTVAASGAALTGGNTIPLIEGVDDIMYMGDGSNVHAFDGQEGANGTYTANVLQLPKEYIIVGFARLEPRTLAVFAHTNQTGDAFARSKTTVFFWDYINEDPFKVLDIADFQCTAAFEYKNTIGCFTQGMAADKATSNRNSKLWLYDGSTFKKQISFIGNAPINGGVDVVEDMIMWNTAGNVFALGSPFKSAPAVINKVTKGTGTSNGALRTVTNQRQYISTGTTTSGGLQDLNNNYVASASISTSLAEPNFSILQKGRIKTVKVVFYATVTSGRAITVQLRNRNSAVGTVINGDTAVSSLEQKFELDTSGNEFTTFDALKCVVTWATGAAATDSPAIDRIEVEFETTNI